jgi:RNA polymerase sigma-70 factor (ECF subfamily)
MPFLGNCRGGDLTEFETEELLERARRLDTDALGRIHDRYYKDVYRYIRYRLDDQQVCEDLASEVFLRLLDALHRRRGPDHNLHGWLVGVASNLVNDHLRKGYRRKVEPLEDAHEQLPAEMASPEQSTESRWQNREIRQALGQLTHEQQHVLALRFADDRSLEETASMIGKTVTAVKALQFRALGSLRRLLEEREAKQ